MKMGSNSKSAVQNSSEDSAKRELPPIGRSAPLGASLEQGGVNFSTYSREATRVDLLLFDSGDTPPSRIITLDPSANRTYHYWHVFVRDCSQDNSMDIVLTGRSTHRKGCVSMHLKCCWTHMDAGSWFPSGTAERLLPAMELTMPRPQ